jgi:plastocyanin
MNKTVVAIVVGLGILVFGGGLVLLNKSKNPQMGIPEKDGYKQSETMDVQSDDSYEAVAEDETEASEEAAAGEVKEFTISASNYKFTPAEIKVKNGETVRIILKNTSGTHDLLIDEFEVATDVLNPGEDEEVEFVVDRIGTFEYYCSVGSHRKMGMVGKLIVE